MIALTLVLSPAFIPMLNTAPQIQTAPHIQTRVSTLTAFSPSGIDGLPLAEQSATVLGIMAALGVGAVGTTATFEAVGEALPDGAGTNVVKASSVLLGAAFIAAGAAHFALPEAYEGIVPPPGTWGLWAVPGSASFHVQWTGVCEALGGLGVLLGALGDAFNDPFSGGRALALRQISAGALFFLMVAVFPANIYQYTHGCAREYSNSRRQHCRPCLCSRVPQRGYGRRWAGWATPARVPLRAHRSADCTAERPEPDFEDAWRPKGGRARQK